MHNDPIEVYDPIEVKLDTILHSQFHILLMLHEMMQKDSNQMAKSIRSLNKQTAKLDVAVKENTP